MSNENIGTRNVLVVEDDPDFAELLAALLRKEGYHTTIAYDGERALEEVHKSKPDLITLDIQIPRKSGSLFYRQMKMSESLRDVPVVVVTGLMGNDRDASTIIRAFLEVEHLPAPAAYVDKPDVHTRLASVVRGLIGDVSP